MTLKKGNAGTTGNGGGIYAQGDTEITLTNTEINSCVAEEDGGGQLYSDTQAGKTKGNKAKNGGGIYLTGNGTAGSTMTGGKVSYNLATDTSAAKGGGGVCAKNADSTDGVFTMQNGTITGNRAYKKGGAAEVHGVFTWEGGSIAGNHVNTAPRGQIIHKDGGRFNNPHHYTAN